MIVSAFKSREHSMHSRGDNVYGYICVREDGKVPSCEKDESPEIGLCDAESQKFTQQKQRCGQRGGTTERYSCVSRDAFRFALMPERHQRMYICIYIFEKIYSLRKSGEKK